MKKDKMNKIEGSIKMDKTPTEAQLKKMLEKKNAKKRSK